MKKEMAEKEAKYAEMDASVEAANVSSDLNDDDDVLMRDSDTMYRIPVDENGNYFVIGSGGSINLGFICSESGLTEAPIRLSEGNDNYGLKHIEQNHGEEIRNAGYNNVENFVEDVAAHYDTIRKGKSYVSGKQTYLIEVSDNKNNTLFIELSKDGSYWSVNSAGVLRKGYSRNKEIVWSIPAVGQYSTTKNTGVAGSIAENEGSLGSTSGNSRQTKKDAARRVMDLSKSILPTSETGSGAIRSSANIPQIFNAPNIAENKLRQNTNAGEIIKRVNDRFNNELEQQIAGKLPQGHIYQIGMPGDILRAAGFPMLPIEMSSSRLAEKANQSNHPFPIKGVRDLPIAMNNPIAVFNYGTNAKNVIVDLNYRGNQFLVGVHFNQTREGIEISSVRGLFPKENANWLNWISQGKSEWLDKEKIQVLIDQQRTNFADVAYLNLDDVAKIVEKFENPKLPQDDSAIHLAVLRREMAEHVKNLAKKLNLDDIDVVTRISGLQGKKANLYNEVFDALALELHPEKAATTVCIVAVFLFGIAILTCVVGNLLIYVVRNTYHGLR